MTGTGSGIQGLPTIITPSGQAAAVGAIVGSFEIDDAALTDVAYQQSLVARAKGEVGAAFEDLVGQVGEHLARPPWHVVVRGLPVEQATSILVVISATLGELVEPYRQPWSRVVRRIQPRRDRMVDGRALNEHLHTDGTDWPQPNDYTCLFCVRPDEWGEGVSLMLDVATLLHELSSRQVASLLDRLVARPAPWRVADELGGGVHWAPVLRRDPDGIRWLHHTITSSWVDGLVDVDDEMVEDLRRFEEAVETCAGITRLMLHAGDLLILDNLRCLHARTALAHPDRSSRELRRTKVMRRA
jgi:hypothetical protein